MTARFSSIQRIRAVTDRLQFGNCNFSKLSASLNCTHKNHINQRSTSYVSYVPLVANPYSQSVGPRYVYSWKALLY